MVAANRELFSQEWIVLAVAVPAAAELCHPGAGVPRSGQPDRAGTGRVGSRRAGDRDGAGGHRSWHRSVDGGRHGAIGCLDAGHDERRRVALERGRMGARGRRAGRRHQRIPCRLCRGAAALHDARDGVVRLRLRAFDADHAGSDHAAQQRHRGARARRVPSRAAADGDPGLRGDRACRRACVAHHRVWSVHLPDGRQPAGSPQYRHTDPADDRAAIHRFGGDRVSWAA